MPMISVPGCEFLARQLVQRGWAVSESPCYTSAYGYRARASKTFAGKVRTFESAIAPTLDLAMHAVFLMATNEELKQREAEYYPGPRVCIVGYGRHGKDEAALALHGFYRFKCAGSTSWQALPFIAKELNLPEQHAWEQRHANRQFWKDFCDKLRADDPLFLVRRALKVGNVIAGIRDKVEIEKAIEERTFDAILWIDRPGFDKDPTVTFTRDLATDSVVNDRTLDDLRRSVVGWASGRFGIPICA